MIYHNLISHIIMSAVNSGKEPLRSQFVDSLDILTSPIFVYIVGKRGRGGGGRLSPLKVKTIYKNIQFACQVFLRTQ